MEASRSSPSAAPSAVSKPLATVTRVERPRPAVAGGGREQLGEGARFRFQALRRPLRLRQRSAAAGLRLAGSGHGGAGPPGFLLGLRGGAGGRLRRAPERVEIRRRGRVRQLAEVARGGGPLGGEAPGALALLPPRPLQRGAAGPDVRVLRQEPVDLRFHRGQLRLGLPRGALGRLAGAVGALRPSRQFRALGFEARDRRLRVGPLGGGARKIPLGVGALPLQLGEAFGRPALLGVERARGRGGGAADAAAAAASASRKAGRAWAATAWAVAALACSAARSATACPSASGRLLGVRRGRPRLGEGERVEKGVQAPDLGRERPVARRLAALALEAVELRLDLAEHVLGPQTRLSSAALRRSSASCRRAWRPAMPAASSRMRRRACGFAAISSAIWPWRTRAGERGPVAASANRSCTSRSRTSRPLIR